MNNEEKPKKKKEQFKTVVESYKRVKAFKATPKGKAIFFFGFYVFFFIFLFSFMGSLNSVDSNKNPDNDTRLNFSVEKITTEDYKFSYLVTSDKTVKFAGRKEGLIYYFTKEDETKITNYKQENEIFTENDIVVDNPFKPSLFFNINEINKIIKNAKFNYKTEYVNEEILYNYSITVGELVKILAETNISDERVVVIDILTKNKEAYKFTIDLSYYMNYLDNAIDSYKIELNYEFE